MLHIPIYYEDQKEDVCEIFDEARNDCKTMPLQQRIDICKSIYNSPMFKQRPRRKF